ncbi:MAG: FtsX-like permease family protein [Anaerolineales bacterium]
MKAKKSFVRPRWNKVLADLWDNKTRTLLVVASIAVGVFAIGAIITAYMILSEDIHVSYAAVNPANIEIMTDPFDDDFLRSIKEIPGVGEVEGRHNLRVSVIQDGETQQNLDLIAVKDFENSKINMRDHVEGAPMPGVNELLIGYEPMRDSGYRVGDVLSVQIADGTIRHMPVVGIAADQTAVGGFEGSPIGYVTQDSLVWLGERENYNRLYARVSDDSNDEEYIQGISDAIEDKLEKSGRQIYRANISKSNEHPFGDMALAIFGILGALGVLVVLLSTSLIVNTLNALITQHLRQIGVMKLVGARSLQILGMYLLLILLYGIIALIIAVPLGALAGYEMAQLMAFFMKANLQDFRIIPVAVVIQIMIALIVPLVAGFFPVNSGSKITVRRAISNDRPGDQPTISGWWDRLGRLTRWLSRPVLLSIRNTFRRKGRLLLTLFTLTVSGAIFIAVFNVRVSMQEYMIHLTQHFMADITLDFEQPYRIAKVQDAVFQIPGVEDIEAWSGASAEILDPNGDVVENLLIIAPPADSALLDPDMVAGRWLLPGDGKAIVISDAIWDTIPDLKPGDTLRLSVSGGREDDWTLVGVFSFTNFMGDPLSYAPYESISGLQNMSNQASSYRLVTNDQSLEGQEKFSTALDQYLRARGFHVSSIQTGAETREQSAQMVNILVVFLLTMALLTAVVGSIGLTGTMGMNVLERTREIGVMRAIGAVDFAIMKSVVFEGVFISLISWSAALLVSFPISFLLLKIISEAMINAPIPLAFTLDGFLIWLGVVLALSVFASILPARSAARLTIREVLAYE